MEGSFGFQACLIWFCIQVMDNFTVSLKLSSPDANKSLEDVVDKCIICESGFDGILIISTEYRRKKCLINAVLTRRDDLLGFFLN